MKFKANVKFGNPILAMVFAAMAAESAYQSYGYECIITSVNDSTHSTNSLHYKDQAFDLRTKHVIYEQHKDKIFDALRASLTADFDLVFENRGKDSEHIHLEYDPK